jgi:hypothetical protein
VVRNATEAFRGIVGYSSPADCLELFTISWEKQFQVDDKDADVVLGIFCAGKERVYRRPGGQGPARHSSWTIW